MVFIHGSLPATTKIDAGVDAVEMLEPYQPNDAECGRQGYVETAVTVHVNRVVLALSQILVSKKNVLASPVFRTAL